ncbi:hypothetical protein [Consotaella salsifontis]|uniref:HdeA/HdeB family protein n=1 Tax=Consotaella salsifontis TaxID=1365950 RepID=A0A1T4NZL5_9HYPH|nr:hypothetical protein [Consotaella salsifontis]SJZ84552.1 hypothetical protein SAMN05428963_103259 [Consotaella salsifontis]
MKMLLVAAVALGAFSHSAFAADDMTCASFTAMDSNGQMSAVHAMNTGMMSGGDMADKDSASKDAMAKGTNTSGAMMSDEDMAMKVAKACDGHPDMMVKDAMHESAM